MAKETQQKKTLEDVLKELDKKYGPGSVMSGKNTGGYDDVVSTGSLSLDIATGIGGIAISKEGNGKIYELIGWESSGKSTITQTIIGNAQKKGIKCLLMDGENSLDEKYATALGINLSDLLVIQLDEHAGEGAYDKMFALIETGEIGLVVIDSYNSLQPKKIVEGETGDQSIGLHARMLGKVIMKANTYCTKYGTTFLFIGQLREKIGVMFGPTETTQGGNAPKFYAHVRMQISRSTTTANSVMEGEDKLGNLTKVHIIKNKLAKPFKKAEFNILYSVGIDHISELVELAKEAEILKIRGGIVTLDDMKYPEEEFKLMLVDNEEFYNSIRNRVLEYFKVNQLEKQEHGI